MRLYYFLSCTLATGSLLIFPQLRTPKVSEIRGAQLIPVTQLTYDASVDSVESVLIEKWRSMGFAMPIDGQTFAWDRLEICGAGPWVFRDFPRRGTELVKK